MPKRTITAVIPVQGSSVPLSVKTSVPVPKHLIPDVMSALGGMDVVLPVEIGDILIQNILDTGSDIVATRSLRTH